MESRIVKCCICSTGLYGAETRTFQKVDQKCLEIFEMLCWRRTAKISCADRVKNEEVLHRDRERNCFLKHVSEVKITGMDRSDTKMRRKMYTATE
jgi:hypothetical protein